MSEVLVSTDRDIDEYTAHNIAVFALGGTFVEEVPSDDEDVVTAKVLLPDEYGIEQVEAVVNAVHEMRQEFAEIIRWTL